MFLFLLSTLALAGLGACASVNECPATITRDKYLQVHGDKCYRFVLSHRKEYPEALVDCKTDGGTLVMIKSQDIQDYVYAEMMNTYSYYTGKQVWIGLTDKETEHEWKWEDGTPIDYSNWRDGTVPSETGVHDFTDCATINPDGGMWDDQHCENQLFGLIKETRPYICQYDVKTS